VSDGLIEFAEEFDSGSHGGNPGDRLNFAPEDASAGVERWKVLIVDDEHAVHRVTRQTLKDFEFDGKRLQFFSAYSPEEARQIISANPDIAVVLLDVVMGEANAGLTVARYIREVLNNRLVRIVLRTGRPEDAPEERVIREYDINDYREKSELTARRLCTTMVATLRSYRDLRVLDTGKRGLEYLLASSPMLLETQSMQRLASGILAQLQAVLSLTPFRRPGPGLAAVREPGGEITVLAATGAFYAGIGRPVREVAPPAVLAAVEKAVGGSGALYSSGWVVKGFRSRNGAEGIIFMEGATNLTDWEKRLIDLFTMNVAVVFDNLNLNREIEETQREIIFTLGEFSEARSRETGNHVKRVAEYSGLLAQKAGLPPEEAELVKMASPMHDVGKLGIADAILNKPGQLSPEEFEVIKAHGTLGYEILRNSSRRIMQAAAIIALQHHERYDGTGYPQGLKGEEIHIFGRITAMADVFDALGSERVYKKAWPMDRILDYFRSERGRHFDPRLVDLFFANLPEFLQIKDSFADHFPLAHA